MAQKSWYELHERGLLIHPRDQFNTLSTSSTTMLVHVLGADDVASKIHNIAHGYIGVDPPHPQGMVPTPL